MTQPLREDPTTELGKRIPKWLEDLDIRRGARAELRRIQNPEQAELCREAWHFVGLFDDLELYADPRLIAQAAGLLVHFKSHLTSDKYGTFAHRMAETHNGRPRVSPLRFRRLLAAPDRVQLFHGLRRMIPLLDRQGDLINLLMAWLHWNNQRGEDIRRAWARDYFQTLEKTHK